MARLAVMLGGRSAEEIALGDVTTGAENDLVEATRLARCMVTRWGMGSLGLVAFRARDPFYVEMKSRFVGMMLVAVAAAAGSAVGITLVLRLGVPAPAHAFSFWGSGEKGGAAAEAVQPATQPAATRPSLAAAGVTLV